MTNWKFRENNGCENYIVNNICVASYSPTIFKNDPKGDYRGHIFLPGINKHKIAGNKEDVKKQIENLVNMWLKQINRE